MKSSSTSYQADQKSSDDDCFAKRHALFVCDRTKTLTQVLRVQLPSRFLVSVWKPLPNHAKKECHQQKKPTEQPSSLNEKDDTRDQNADVEWE